MKMMKEKFSCELLSGARYDGFCRDVSKSNGIMTLEFQPKFAKHCYSKFVKTTIPLSAIKNSTHYFKWNATCPKCGFKAKNKRGLAIHRAKKCDKVEQQINKPIKMTYTRVKSDMVKLLNTPKRKINKPLQVSITTPTRPKTLREKYRVRMSNYELRMNEHLR